MKFGKYFTFSNCLAVISAGICVAAVTYSYRSQAIVKRAEDTFAETLKALQQDIGRIESKLASVSANGYSAGRSAPVKKFPAASISGGASATEAGDSGVADILRSQQDEIVRLKEIIDATGLDQLSEYGDLDLTVLKELSQRRSRMMEMVSSRQANMEKNTQRHNEDDAFYGGELGSLYEKARIRFNRNSDEKEREAAFNEIIQEYPDSYATASLLAERALEATAKQDTESVEKYYHMLLDSGNEAARDVIAGQGIEAMPMIETYLARQYIRDGRTQDAKEMIDSLDENYANSMVFLGRGQGGRRGGPPAQPVYRVVEQLRNALE